MPVTIGINLNNLQATATDDDGTSIEIYFQKNKNIVLCLKNSFLPSSPHHEGLNVLFAHNF